MKQIIDKCIRCFYCVMYNKQNDTVNTFVREYTIDGIQCTCPIPVEFHFDDRVILYAGKKVVPQRHYDELTSAFLSENPELDSRIRDFLNKHPECFGNGSTRDDSSLNYVTEWTALHRCLTLFETDEEYRELIGIKKNTTGLEEDVFQLFKKEELGV